MKVIMSQQQFNLYLVFVLCLTLVACNNTQKRDDAPTGQNQSSTNETSVNATETKDAVESEKIPAPSPTVNAIELSAMPTAINFDNIPGPDGVRIRIVLWQIVSDVPRAIALEKGIVECLLFEGQVAPDSLNEKKPAIIWRYSADSLSRSMSKSIVGYKYNTSLRWNDENAPKGSTITIAVRLLRPGRPPLYAKPINLALGPK